MKTRIVSLNFDGTQIAKTGNTRILHRIGDLKELVRKAMNSDLVD